MKAGIHPRYEPTVIVCACGNQIETRSTKQNLRIDLCNVCHPFYTGEQRIVDTAGQVERFMKKVESATGQARPSKRQQRITVKQSRIDEDRRRTEEAARAAAAERAAARKAQLEAEADANALNALLGDAAAEETSAEAAVEEAPVEDALVEEATAETTEEAATE
jgi:large subunit ribosomal protein L31